MLHCNIVTAYLTMLFLFECKSAQHIPLQTETLGVGAIKVCIAYYTIAYFINAHFEDHVNDMFLALL